MANNLQSYSLKQLMKADTIKQKFNDVLGKRAPQFMTSLLNVVNSNQSLQNVDSSSVISSALVAASLNLPINQNLGYMYLVPYKGTAQPQMGYKGYIQLAQRSGQYKRLNAIQVYKDELKGWNPLSEELRYEPNFKDRGNEKPVGYVGRFELLNGFEKTVFWTYEQIDEHRQRFSKMSGSSKPSGVWASDFDAMALKTVLRNLLTKWGPMTVDIQTAFSADEEVDTGNTEPLDVTNSAEETEIDQLAQQGKETKRKAKPVAAKEEVKSNGSQAKKESAATDGKQTSLLDNKPVTEPK